MHEPQGARPRARSPFAAAFLSLIFPGLGQRMPARPCAPWRSPPAPILAARARRRDRSCGSTGSPCSASSSTRPSSTRSSSSTSSILDLPARRDRRRLPGRRVPERRRRRRATAGSAGPRLGRNPLSIAGLLAVILVMAGSHVVVARYDMLAKDVLDSGCIFIGDHAKDVRPRRLADARASAGRRPPRRATTARPIRRRPTPPSPRARRSAAPSRRCRSRRGTARSA